MDGVLSFKFPPDYEDPEGGEPDAVSKTNIYKVVVVAADDAPGAEVSDDTDIREKTYYRLTIIVTDVDEDGMVALSSQQPQEDVILIATLTDDDGVTSPKYKWHQSPNMDGPWTLVSGQTRNSYDAPAADVADQYLRVTVTYTDRHGSGKTAMAVSAHAVREEPAGGNAAPVFDDDIVRSVNENSPPGTNVGKPVTAGDAGDVLTYTLGPNTDLDNNLYTIDPATGQIMVGPRTTLNAEATSGPGGTDRDTANDDGLQHQVTVIARDPHVVAALAPGDGPDDGAVSATVTITIKNVNEAPMVTGGPTKVERAEGDIDTTTDGIQPAVGTYAATDTEISADGSACTAATTDAICEWSLTGPDAADFNIVKVATDFGRLSFKKAPDYEKPIDADMDNMYMVTVVVTDSGVDSKNKMTAMRDVVIEVTNAEDGGTVTFSSVQPLGRCAVHCVPQGRRRHDHGREVGMA